MAKFVAFVRLRVPTRVHLGQLQVPQMRTGSASERLPERSDVWFQPLCLGSAVSFGRSPQLGSWHFQPAQRAAPP
jgi:hypothetical protein